MSKYPTNPRIEAKMAAARAKGPLPPCPPLDTPFCVMGPVSGSGVYLCRNQAEVDDALTTLGPDFKQYSVLHVRHA